MTAFHEAVKQTMEWISEEPNRRQVSSGHILIMLADALEADERAALQTTLSGFTLRAAYCTLGVLIAAVVIFTLVV